MLEINKKSNYQRVMITLPKPLVSKLQKYAKSMKGGNKSGFVADAIKAYVDYLWRVEHTKKIRESYKASAEERHGVANEWRFADAQLAQRMYKNEEENGN